MPEERGKALAKRAQIEKGVDPPEHVVLGKNFMLGHGYIKNDFDVHQWAAPEFLDQAARELREEQWKKVTTSMLPETAASLASGERLG
jgi:hypothetical protein